ncbi:MAG TPA: PGPGW domain-containing protein [Candidatus Saccharimonadia bacterium]|nr:PGPGW domain-containing protein [Candidatus Saccharimonadia bacterium]
MSVLSKSVWSVSGGVLVLAGLVMLVTPGPGLLAIAAGVALWAREYDWAKRLLERVRGEIAKRRGDGREP